MSICFESLHTNFLASRKKRSLKNQHVVIVLPQELELVIIEAFYGNGQSPMLVRCCHFSRVLKWCSIVPKLTNEQIKKVFKSQLMTKYTLKKTSRPWRSRRVITDKRGSLGLGTDRSRDFSAGPETARFRFCFWLARFCRTGTGCFEGKFSVCRT
jgi:hypothetical protein